MRMLGSIPGRSVAIVVEASGPDMIRRCSGGLYRRDVEQDLDAVADEHVARAEGRVELHLEVRAVELRARGESHAIVALRVGLGALQGGPQRDRPLDAVELDLALDLELVLLGGPDGRGA